MTLQEQATEYKELADLTLTALKSSYSAGVIVGYTTNGTKVTYTNETALRQSLAEYRQKQAHANAQITQLNFLGYSS
jgi:hypothetical protein